MKEDNFFPPFPYTSTQSKIPPAMTFGTPWLMHNRRTGRVVLAPRTHPSEEFETDAQIYGARCIDASDGSVTRLDDVHFLWEQKEELSTDGEESGGEEEEEWESEAESESETELEPPLVQQTTTMRKIGIASRARRAFDTLAHEDSDFMLYMLKLLHTQNVADIYSAHGDRWATRKAIDGVHTFKVSQKTGTCGIVVLAMIPKASDDRVLIVNAFRRTHKKGLFYRTTPMDVEKLRSIEDDAFGELSSACV